MKKVSSRPINLFLCLGLFLLVDGRNTAKSTNAKATTSSSPLKLSIQDQYVRMENGHLQLILSNPGGSITNLTYKDGTNLLEVHNEEDSRGYWDLVWRSDSKSTSGKGASMKVLGKIFKVIVEDHNQIEVSFKTTWDSSVGSKSVPLNIDKRFVMLRDKRGFYSYGIFEHKKGWPDLVMEEARIAFKLRKDLFHYMAVSDSRKRIMPMPEDRDAGRPLAYPEAVLLTNPTNPELKGEVDDKYQYSSDNKDNRVHGWISFNPPVGFWMINPSDEFRTGGPVKQDLSSHVGPTTLSMFVSLHYAGDDLKVKLQGGEYWKKVFGPVYIHLNSASDEKSAPALWDDGKKQMETEVQSWPYSFPASTDFPKPEQRGSVSGQLSIRDSFLKEKQIPANAAFLGLAAIGDPGSWQTESKGYQFWTRADSAGSFSINGVRPGDYNLYGWVPGFIGDYKHVAKITIKPGDKLVLGNLIYQPPRHGPTLWEIGIPDRSAAEFYVPDPKQEYINKLYVPNSNDRNAVPVDKFRQYGLWEKYAELYPLKDLVYTAGVSDYRQDWFFAHVNRRIGSNTFKPTTWKIVFKLDKVNKNPNRTYMLRVALASASNCELQVRFNNPNVNPPHFTTRMIGDDNAIARHGIHGLYWLYNIQIQSGWLVNGENTIFLTQSKRLEAFQGFMYDYIRLEGPSM